MLAIATWLAVAYRRRREKEATRHLVPEPGPAELDLAQQAALPPCRHSHLQQGVALLCHLL